MNQCSGGICPTASHAYEGDSYSIINSLLNWVSCFPGFSPFLCTIFSRVSSSFCDALVTMAIIVLPFQKENINCCDYYWLNQWICSHICPFRIYKNVLDTVKSMYNPFKSLTKWSYCYVCFNEQILSLKSLNHFRDIYWNHPFADLERAKRAFSQISISS